MKATDWIVAGLGILSVLIIPLLVIAFRGAIKWTKVEDKLDTLVTQITKLVEDKEKTHAEIRSEELRMHAEILEQMRADRDATDRRLRFIEEWFMKQGQGVSNAL